MDDAVWGYAAPVSGLSVADNEMKVTIYPSPAKGYEAFFTRLGEEFPALIQVDQVVPYYTVVNHVECWPEKKPTHIQIERTPGSMSCLCMDTFPEARSRSSRRSPSTILRRLQH